jgi:dCMP deaminase
LAKTRGNLPDPHKYFMGIAMAVRQRANCLGSSVGAVIVSRGRIISTGYNGTPENMPNCLDGGCHRCKNRDAFPSGTGYDLCICVHAEQNAILSAARFGIPIEGSTVYTTMRPCFGCTKEMLQAKVGAVYYLRDWAHPDPTHMAEYERLQTGFARGIRRIDMTDPDAEWANPKRPPQTTGSKDSAKKNARGVPRSRNGQDPHGAQYS